MQTCRIPTTPKITFFEDGPVRGCTFTGIPGRHPQEFINFPQFSAIFRNFPQFFRNFFQNLVFFFDMVFGYA
jgi:hypothetical protein